MTPKEEEKIRNFKWSGEEDGLVNQPEFDVADKILDCAEAIAEYAVEHIDVLDLQQDVYHVNVPIEVHPLLQSRYNNDYSDYSRSRVFDLIRSAFIQLWESLGYDGQLKKQISQLCPSTEIEISSVDLYDEPDVDVEVNGPIIDMLAPATRKYNFSGNTVTVDFKIELRAE